MKVFGDSYATPDGTCLRDYIHVQDLCSAHLAAIDHMDGSLGADVFNLGNGSGFSVLDVIRAAEAVTGKSISYTIEPPRAGDSASLVANSEKARRVLGWQPEYSDLGELIETAWKWHQDKKY